MLDAIPAVDDPRSADELLEEIRLTIEEQEALLAERYKIAASDISGLAFHGDTPICPAAGQTQHGVGFDLLETGDLKAARTIHLRRQLAQAAEHGASLLAALGLPRLVDPDFVPLDRAAIGDALDVVIAHLNDLDALGEDMEPGGDDEPSLAWTESGPRFCGDYQDREHDTADCEPSLASPERHPAVPAWSTPGHYVDRGPDSSQLRWAEGAQHDGEIVNEDGDDLDTGEHDEVDKEPSIGWPNDYRAKLSDAFQPYLDAEEVDEDGSETGHEDEYHPWRFRRPDAVQIAAEAGNV